MQLLNGVTYQWFAQTTPQAKILRYRLFSFHQCVRFSFAFWTLGCGNIHRYGVRSLGTSSWDDSFIMWADSKGERIREEVCYIVTTTQNIF